MPFAGLLTAGISAGSSILGGIFGSSAAKKAAKQQSEAYGKAINIQGDQVNKNVNDVWQAEDWANQKLNPYAQAGATSLSSLQDLAGANGPLTNKFSFNPSDLEKDPGYAFTLKQGQDAIARSAAAQGKLYSGGTLKSLAGYTTGTANQYFGDAFNRAKTTFDTNQGQAMARIGTLQGLAGLGYNASSQQSTNDLTASKMRVGLGEDYANNVGGLLTGQGNAQAQGTQNSARSWLNALNGGTQSTLQYLAGKKPSDTNGPGVTMGPLSQTMPQADPSLVTNPDPGSWAYTG